MARALGVNVRALYRWRSGVWPDAAHFLALLEFAAQRGLLYCLLENAERPGQDRVRLRAVRPEFAGGERRCTGWGTA